MKLKHYIKKINDKKAQWNIAINEHHEAKKQWVMSWYPGMGKKDKKFKDKFIKITLLTYYMFSGHIVYVFMW